MTAQAATQEETQPQDISTSVPGQFTSQLPSQSEDRGRTQLREARMLQRFIFRDASAPEIKPSDLALLARAWCALQESIRVLRGIPLPGQFRPDEVKMKRGRRGDNLIELARAGGSSFAEASEAQAPKEHKAQ